MQCLQGSVILILKGHIDFGRFVEYFEYCKNKKVLLKRIRVIKQSSILLNSQTSSTDDEPLSSTLKTQVIFSVWQ